MFRVNYLPIIKQEVQAIRRQYNLSEKAPIGDYIFTILKNECILVEWPEDEQTDLDGFSTQKVINGQLETVVYINSIKNKEKQNFCAAHELGHRHQLEVQIKDEFPDDVFTSSIIEDIMNRFAAELMMPESDFRRRGKKLYQQCLSIRDGKRIIHVKKLIEVVIQLMDFYYVPYKAVVLRMQEVGIISNHVCMYLQNFDSTEEGRNVIEAIIKEYGITRLRTPDRKVQYSVSLEGIYGIMGDREITKYMDTAQVKEYLKNIGFAEEDIQLIEDMKKIENETINIDEM